MDFSSILQSWYSDHQRALPWRETKDPYSIWLSEIILQQTRVQQGMSYYLKFMEHFPTVSDLAEAHEDEVLKLWQGLGYYSRARNLLAAARHIHTEHQGVFPATYPEIRSLKGVGDYTAAAIASFAYELPHAVVDGNVFRLLSRVFGIETPIDSTEGKKEFWKLANDLLDTNQPGNHNQAMMEFGSMQCVPRNPNCSECPLMDQCKAFATQKIGLLPVKAKKTKQTKRFFHFLIVHEGGSIFLDKREAKGIWRNLYQFPLIEVAEETDNAVIPSSDSWKKWVDHPETIIRSVSPPMKHILSHQQIFARFWELEINNSTGINLENYFLRIPIAELDNYAIPRLIERYLEGRENNSQIGLPFNFS